MLAAARFGRLCSGSCFFAPIGHACGGSNQGGFYANDRAAHDRCIFSHEYSHAHNDRPNAADCHATTNACADGLRAGPLHHQRCFPIFTADSASRYGYGRNFLSLWQHG